jgi:hypothetical protein
MGLFEVVLRFPDRDDVRLGDDVHELGAVVTDASGRRWRVAGREDPQSSFADGRYILLPAPEASPVASGLGRPHSRPRRPAAGAAGERVRGHRGA